MDNTTNENCLIDKVALAKRLGIVPRTVDNLIAANAIPFIRIGKKLIRFDWETVKRHLAKY